MFSNSYLKCYFKLQDERKKLLNPDNNVEEDFSIESLEEHESMMKIQNEHAYNQP